MIIMQQERVDVKVMDSLSPGGQPLLKRLLSKYNDYGRWAQPKLPSKLAMPYGRLYKVFSWEPVFQVLNNIPGSQLLSDVQTFLGT